MRNNTKLFELTTFIKNVLSTLDQVAEVAFDYIGCGILCFGVGAKVAEMYNATEIMPISFYSDTGLDVLAILGYLKYRYAINMLPWRRTNSCAILLYSFI
jgi:hypothetical protein